MTAKQEVYRELQLDGSNIKELQRRHPSLQAKKAGNSTWLIRFKSTEDWKTIEDWKVTYKQSYLKRLTDLALSAKVILPPESMLSTMPNRVLNCQTERVIRFLYREANLVYDEETSVESNMERLVSMIINHQ